MAEINESNDGAIMKLELVSWDSFCQTVYSNWTSEKFSIIYNF